MPTAHLLSTLASGAPADWVLGTVASIGFVLVIGIPAAALNARDRKRRQQQAGR